MILRGVAIRGRPGGRTSASREAAMTRTPSRLLAGGAVLYVALVGGIFLWHGVVATPDLLIVALLPLAVLSGRFVAWVQDWIPFVGILLGWEAMRSVADRVSPSAVHTGSLFLERWLTAGRLPEVALQQALDRGALGALLDRVTAAVDLLHFPAIVAVAFLVWMHGRRAFLGYSIALYATAFIAFAVFILAPTAPPWYAEEHGWIQGLQHVMTQVMPVRWSGFYQSLDPNPVAAVPSLHSAFPFLGFLVLRSLRSPVAGPMLAWSVLVWFSVVYLGEHYVLDVVAGVILATLCWKASSVLLRARSADPVAHPAPA